MKFDKNMTAVGTSLLILHFLDQQDMYGYQIIHEIQQTSNHAFDFQEGTIYPVLHSLENSKWIESYRVLAENNRIRKYYKITALGTEQLAAKRKEWHDFSTVLNSILEGV